MVFWLMNLFLLNILFFIYSILDAKVQYLLYKPGTDVPALYLSYMHTPITCHIMQIVLCFCDLLFIQ